MRKLFQIKEKWSSSHIPNIFTAGMNTMARAEAMNHFIKKAMIGRYTLVNLFMEILKIETRVIRASREVLNTTDMQTCINHPLMSEIKQRFSKWAFEQVLFQQS